MTIIRKYGNRRLYDTSASRYVNLEDVAVLVRGGEEVTVLDAKTEEDLTREVLLQIILEAHGGVDFLPVGLLRRIIRATGEEPAQRLLRQQLGTALGLLHDQLDRMEGQFSKLFPGFYGAPRPASPKAAAAAPRTTADEAPPEAAPPEPLDAPPSPADPPEAGGELAALRSRLAALEKRLGGKSGK